MKSIIEQASSIMKAIEKAWNQAEQPKEFSIKIFEKEERNFFGMTTKPAKIGIFFGDKPIVHDKQPQRPRPEIKECRPEVRDTKPKAAPSLSPKGFEDKQPQRQQKPQSSPASPSHKASSYAKASSSAKASADTSVDKPEDRPVVRPANPKPVQQRTQSTTEQQQQQTDTGNTDKPRRAPAAWNDTMIATTHNWLKKTLELMNMKSIEFNSEIAGKNLKLTFNAPLIADATHEKQLFRSFAHLIMSSLRNQYKQEIKDLKVILIRPE